MKEETLGMKRFTREEVENLTDEEVEIAFKRIDRDYSYGLLSDRVVPIQNTKLLKEELRRRGYAMGT